MIYFLWTHHIGTSKGFKILPFGLKLWLYTFEQAKIYGQDSCNCNKFIHIKIYNHKFKQLIFFNILLYKTNKWQLKRQISDYYSIRKPLQHGLKLAEMWFHLQYDQQLQPEKSNNWCFMITLKHFNISKEQYSGYKHIFTFCYILLYFSLKTGNSWS